MNLSAQLTPEQRRQVKELVEGTLKNLRERPEVIDEEFLAETEVSDQEYQKGFTLPGG